MFFLSLVRCVLEGEDANKQMIKCNNIFLLSIVVVVIGVFFMKIYLCN